MEHRSKFDAPGIHVFRLGLADQHWDTAVDRFGQFGVALAAESGAGSGIRIYQK